MHMTDDEFEAHQDRMQQKMTAGHYAGLKAVSTAVTVDSPQTDNSSVINEFLGEGPHKPTCFNAALVAIDKTCG